LRGELEYEVEDQRFVLEAGDTLLFAAQLKHRWRNRGKNVCNAVFVLSSFEHGERPSEFHISSSFQDKDDEETSGESES
jgi:quercetin dioxygenase-like cupin family protein